MASVNTDYMMTTYIDDFGNFYPNYFFQFEDSVYFADPNFVAGNVYVPRPDFRISCSANSFFSHRYITATFEDGSTTQFPVPSLQNVSAMIQNILSASGVVCASLEGEQWANIPPAKVGLTLDNFSADTIARQVKPVQETIPYNFNLDGGGEQYSSKISLETLPANIFNAQQGCITSAPQASACGRITGIKPRRYKGKIGYTDGGLSDKTVIVSASTAAEIRACAGVIAQEFNCLGYKGTTIADVSIFYPI